MDNDIVAERIAAILARHASGAPSADALLPQALEILTALRTPTRRMTRAGADIPVGCCMTNSSDAGEVWEYMIDAALAEAKASTTSGIEGASARCPGRAGRQSRGIP